MVAVSSCRPTGCPVRPPPLSSQGMQSHKKSCTSLRDRGQTQAIILALGANREVKERIKGKASRIQCSRIGSALACARWNVQHLELKLLDSTQFVPITVVMVAVSTCAPTGCPVSPLPLSSQNIQSHEKSPTSHRASGETPTMSLALGANREGRERVKGKASRVQSSRIGSVLVCVRRNVQHLELNLPERTQFVLITVVIVAVSASGPACCLVNSHLLLSQNVQSHREAPASHRAASHRARGKAQTMSRALGVNHEGREKIKSKASRIQK